jgi:hypothetical protein
VATATVLNSFQQQLFYAWHEKDQALAELE